jgi:hypothetical protein
LQSALNWSPPLTAPPLGTAILQLVRTRRRCAKMTPGAVLLSGEMAVAYFIGHAPQGFWPVLNQGHPAIMFCFVWLYVSAAGPGPWSLDALRKR